jgi:hypothetical protein
MAGEPGIDYPEEMSPVDVLAASRGDALMSFVEKARDGELLLTVGHDRLKRPVRLEPGERLEVVWKDAAELRSVPAELVGVQTSGEPRWLVRTVGPAARGQRRAAVRAPLAFRVCIVVGDHTLEGRTLDISEGGLRCLLDSPPTTDDGATAGDPGQGGDTGAAPAQAPARAPEVAAVVPVTVWFDGRDHVSAKGEVVRHHPREDGREELSIRFIGLPEKMMDLIRREVFTGLRDLRARGLV